MTTSEPTTAATTGEATSADPSMSPVLVGFHNMEGGAVAVPDMRVGFEAGVEYVNAELGGINGHPVTSHICKVDGSPEAAVNCANEFVQEDVVASVSVVDFSTDAMLPILKSAGIVELGLFAPSVSLDTAVGDAYELLISGAESYAADIVQHNNQGAESVAVVMPDNAASRGRYDEVIAPSAAALGMTTQVFYYPTQADWSTLAAAIVATSPDAVSLWTDDVNTPAAIPALRSAGFTEWISAGSNLNVIPLLDQSVLEKVSFSTSLYTPELAEAPDKARQDLDIFNSYIADSDEDVMVIGAAQFGFFMAVQTADALRQIDADPLTSEAVRDGMGQTKGSQIFRTTDYDCSSPSWPGTTACGGGTLFTTLNEDGELEPLPGQPVDLSGVTPQS